MPSDKKRPIVLPRAITDKPAGIDTKTGRTVSLRTAIRWDKKFPGRVAWLSDL